MIKADIDIVKTNHWLKSVEMKVETEGLISANYWDWTQDNEDMAQK